MKKFTASNTLLVITFLTVAMIAAVGSYLLLGNHRKLSNQGVHQVSLTQQHASPDTLTIKAGEVVQFNSSDGKSHELALGEGGKEHTHEGPFNSGEFGANEAWRATFRMPGTYLMHDHLNPNINILVVVYK